MTEEDLRREFRSIAFELVRLEERCQEVLESVPRSENEAAMFEGRIPWDLSTELRTTVEPLLEGEIRPAIESLKRAPQVTEEDLRQEFGPGRLRAHCSTNDSPTASTSSGPPAHPRLVAHFV